MRQKVKIRRKKTYVAFTWEAELDVDSFRIQRLFSGVNSGKREKISRLKSRLWHKEYDCVHSPVVSGRLDTRSRAKQREWLREKIAEAREVMRRFSEEENKRLSRFRTLQHRKQILSSYIRRLNASVLRNSREDRQKQREMLLQANFEEVRDDLLKQYFRPPFAKNAVVGKSNRHRAVVFAEVEFTRGYGLYFTGNFLLVGIDDNGEEWRILFNEPWEENKLVHEYWVEEAMAMIWDVDIQVVKKSYRQGEILFYPVPNTDIGAEWSEVEETERWEIQPSHIAVGRMAVNRSERLLKAYSTVRVQHPTHPELQLPAGWYRIYIHEKGD